MKLVFATNNKHKLIELQNILGNEFELLSLEEAGCSQEIPENQSTLEGNASQKAFFVYEECGFPCFADDTGLEIDALNGEPGVFSARYAGDDCDSQANMEKVLDKLRNKENRKARFRTVISLIIEGEETQFEGIVEGKIIDKKRGEEGFGYDPIFVPDGYDKTFAEMDIVEKNRISHRARAVHKLTKYLLSVI